MTPFEKLRVLYRAWRYRLKLERHEVQFVLRNLKRGDTAVDVGAHKGAFTWWMRQAVGPQGRVVCFEPQAELADYLQRARQAFHLWNIHIVNAAVSAEAGQATLFRPDGQVTPGATLQQHIHGTHAQSSQVELQSLDGYFARHGGRPIRLIKCDVEGHELEVFRGGEQILDEDRPCLLFECVARLHGQEGTEGVLQFLQQRGYQGFCFSRRGLLSREEMHLSQGGKEHADVINFAFIPNEKLQSVRFAA